MRRVAFAVLVSTTALTGCLTSQDSPAQFDAADNQKCISYGTSPGTPAVMQAYAGIVDKTLTYADLPTLGERLKLPSGWGYSSMVPDKDLVLGASGKAIVVQDELDNTYQKLD